MSCCKKVQEVTRLISAVEIEHAYKLISDRSFRDLIKDGSNIIELLEALVSFYQNYESQKKGIRCDLDKFMSALNDYVKEFRN